MSEREGPSFRCTPGAIEPRQPSHWAAMLVGGCHGSLAVEGMHRNDGPSLFSLTQFAREMRKAPTRSEALLWAQLRGRKLGPRVRRQHVLHPFVVDFFICGPAPMVAATVRILDDLGVASRRVHTELFDVV